MSADKTWREHVGLAEHHLALGRTEIPLLGDGDMPWGFVTEIQPGASYRWSVPVSAHMKAAHPCGLTFTWVCDFERRHASGVLAPDAEQLADIARRLPAAMRVRLAKVLLPALRECEKQIGESRDVAARLEADVATVRRAIGATP